MGRASLLLPTNGVGGEQVRRRRRADVPGSPGLAGQAGRRAGGWAGGGGGGLWAVEGAPGLTPCRRRPRRRHHGHRVEGQVGHRRRRGWWESRFGGGGGWGREGRAAAWPRHFFNFFGCRSGDPSAQMSLISRATTGAA